MAEKQKKMRYTEDELSLITATFKENEDTLMALRKIFFFVPLDKKDKDYLKVIRDNPALMDLVTKTYYPEIELDAPIGQVIDLWLTVDVKEKSPEEARLALLVRQRLMELIKGALKRIETMDDGKAESIIDFAPDFNLSAEELYVEYTARNAVITHSEFQLTQLVALSKMKKETPEERATRLKKDSVK